jgi:hypothetical protein
MTTIKKGFTEVYNILIANEDVLVSDIMSLLVPIMESQQRDKNHYFDDDGNMFVFCYYHKDWEMCKQVEYGKKANTATGLNSMCKVGTNQWTKQQRDFKKSKSNLLELVANGSLAIEDINSEVEKLEITKDTIVTLFDHHFDEALEDARQLEDEA